MRANERQTKGWKAATAGCNPPLLQEHTVMRGGTTWHTRLDWAKEEPYMGPASPQRVSPWLWVSCGIFFWNKSSSTSAVDTAGPAAQEQKGKPELFSLSFEKFTQTRFKRSSSPRAACNTDKEMPKPLLTVLAFVIWQESCSTEKEEALHVIFLVTRAKNASCLWSLFPFNSKVRGHS